MVHKGVLAAACLLLVACATAAAAKGPQSATDAISRDALPPEAIETLHRIESGGPFPYANDGRIFENRERRLPGRPRGYYREFTVPTPGLHNRGAQRVILGRDHELYYTQDHYRTFKRIRE